MAERVLIVDDEPHIRRMMRLTLETAGYEVMEASDGAEALQIYGDGSTWTAVVLDQRMPGMDGLETLRELKRRNVSVAVVMATAYASIELAVDAMKLGATDFVRKPMTPEVLRNAVAAAMSKQSGASALAPAATSQAVQTITMNGFTVLDEPDVITLDDNQRRYTVVSPAGERHVVLVEIDPEVVNYVARMTNQHFAPSSSFWTTQAQQLLTDFLWNEGKVPATRRLVLRNFDPDKLAIAARWQKDDLKAKAQRTE